VITVESGPTHARARENSVTLEESGIDLGFQIFRRAGLYLTTAVLAVVAAAALAGAAVVKDVPWLWAPAVVLVALCLVALPGILDARTPVFVADRYGVRLHRKDNWVGLLWREISEIVVDPGGVGRDAHIRIVSRDARQTYFCPVGFTTSVSVAEAEVQLARRRAAAAY
jgi:hypothetical protein